MIKTKENTDLFNVCPRSSDPLYIVSYYIKLGTTSWTYSNILNQVESLILEYTLLKSVFLKKEK